MYEWPLPRESANAEIKAKTIVFELDPPEWFAAWRDCTAYLTMDVLKSKYVDSKQFKMRWDLEDNYQLGWAYKPNSSRSSGTSSFASGSDKTSELGSASDVDEGGEQASAERIVMTSVKKPFKASHYKQV